MKSVLVWFAFAFTSPVVAAAEEAAPPAEPRTTIAVVVGDSWPINGFQYNFGLGVRGSRRFGRIHAGGMLAVHQGDQTTIVLGPVEALGIRGGPQSYRSLPIIMAGDVGYEIPIPLAGKATALVPYLSAGLVVTNMFTDGSYGDTRITRVDPVIGVGALFVIPITPKVSTGIQWRMYSVGDAEFEFGDLEDGRIEHGFSTSIFYSALYAEVLFRI